MVKAVAFPGTVRRNPTLTEHATHILPYRGLGTGIPRALGEWPDIRFEDEIAGNQFKAVIPRPAAGDTTPQVTPQVGTLLARLDGEMTRPDKPNSRNQRYRLTGIGRRWLETHPGGSSN
ncbi:hypothetical protein PIGHUM_02607 [Pigmentiphaga humi]|uniref:Filamentation induced by cAMP protein Fic-like C-terminal domain-containing protein n=1 Tax=Pigmentiphaga humi TaxID=2478468 RepID=A0A3P4B5U8_9BURK|nr:hypothetical protein [Pigmentiphaga humi]VCU70535.1 hypothetical protein PIGHUM_02607 [Pigmentiphaga humi]